MCVYYACMNVYIVYMINKNTVNVNKCKPKQAALVVVSYFDAISVQVKKFEILVQINILILYMYIAS